MGWRLTALMLVALASPAGADEPRDAGITCEQLEVWGESDKGEPFNEYMISCRVPDRLKTALEGELTPDQVVAAACYAETRYQALAAVAALGKLHALSPANRMRLVLEVALRQGEPFASARIGFVFGAEPWWDPKFAPGPDRHPSRALGTLAMPWDPGQTAVIREYLFPKVPNRKVSMLAVYQAKLMAEAGKLDRAIIPDLKKVIRLKPKSFEADLAGQALAALRE